MDEAAKPAKRIGLYLGPGLALVMLLCGAPEGLSYPAWATAALLVWMAAWWATEAIPIPATSLLPLAAIPMIGAGSPAQAASGYSNPIVMLLMGGFILAVAVERWELHKRIALKIVSLVSRSATNPAVLILGFMIATALISMWISNTATALMMTPIALSAAAVLKQDDVRFATALLLGICYASSIGGIATPIGTPTNLIAIQWLENHTQTSIGYACWMSFGVPAMLLLIPVAWWAVCRGLPRKIEGSVISQELHVISKRLGKITKPEKRTALLFGIVALLWIARVPVQMAVKTHELDWSWLHAIDDMGIAIAGACALFLIPAGTKERRALLKWQEASKLPWGVLILFGGCISISDAVTRTGLSSWLGDQLGALSVLPPILFVAAVVTLVIFLTELTSNVATMTTMAPILGALSVAVGVAPQSLLAPAAVAASCAFMLPVATPPNAIAYATEKVPIGRMMRAGLLINLAGIVIITAIGYWLAPRLL